VPSRARTTETGFPDPSLADATGLIAVGGDLSPRRLLTAYAMGIFPWYAQEDPILWWSPDPRFILEFDRFRPGKSLQKTIRRGVYEIRADSAFEEVILRCAAKSRPGQEGTWITPEMREAYLLLHRLGFAHSVEAYCEGRLAGGLYGVSLGGSFCGESMFADQPDASKVALARLVESLASWRFDFIDCQISTEHLRRLGAREISREEFLSRLAASLKKPTRRGRWDLAEAGAAGSR
jgi:leucyl/phenylalanyl-tRNA--protein transferase